MAGKSPTKTVRLTEMLRRRISRGEFTDPPRPLPTEPQLMAEYGVGRGTVRQAVEALVREGLVETVQGSGTRVRKVEPIIHLDAHLLLAPAFSERRSTWGEECAAQGIEGTVRILSARKVKAPPDVAALLGTAAAFVRRRLHLADGRPAQLLDTYYRAAQVAFTRVTDRKPLHPSVLSYMESDLGVRFGRARTEWRVRRAAAAEAERLLLPEGAPVFDLTRVITGAAPGDEEPGPVLVDRGVYSDRHRVVYELDL